MAYETLSVVRDGNVATVTINRPTVLNALNETVLKELTHFLHDAEATRDLRALILTGSGERSFIAGADIAGMQKLTPVQALRFARLGQDLTTALEEQPFITIARVNGFALGGGFELALACHIRIASDNAKFGLPEVSLGVIPGFGGTVRMSRAVGQRKARELTYTGGMITAAEALDAGLVNKVVPAAELMAAVMKTVEAILSKAPLAVTSSKVSINQAWDMDVEEAQKNEAKIFAELFNSEDVKEGTAAFIEKRKANFKGE